MTELRRTYSKYPGFYTDQVKSGDGWTTIQKPMTPDMMLPDCVLDALQKAAILSVQQAFDMHLALNKIENVLPSLDRHRLSIPEPQISWEQTCALTIAAFARFDPMLGIRVADILSDPSRIKLTTAEPGEANGYCTPPGWNGLTRAEINYAHDGTINDAAYLAHELGHLLASDFAQENGFRGKDAWMPKSMAEVPAMFAQCILYDYLMNGQENPVLQNVARQHFIGEVTRNLYEQQIAHAQPADRPVPQGEHEAKMMASLGENWTAFSKARERQRSTSDLHSHISASTIGAGLFFGDTDKNADVFNAFFGQGRHSDILKTLHVAGIKTQDSLETFMSKAVTASKAPLETVYSSRFSKTFGSRDAKNISKQRNPS